MSCTICPNLITPTSITTASGVTTITVASTFTPAAMNSYCFLLRTAIPVTSTCNSIAITNGTTTWNVLKCDGNNWRPCMLKCNSVIKLKFLDDPVHFLVKSVKRCV